MKLNHFIDNIEKDLFIKSFQGGENKACRVQIGFYSLIKLWGGYMIFEFKLNSIIDNSEFGVNIKVCLIRTLAVRRK